MKRLARLICLSVLTALLTPLPSFAQSKGAYELGLDAGFNLQLIDDVDDNLLAVGFPASSFGGLLQNLRVGYYVDETLELETSLGFSYLSNGNDTVWRAGLRVNALYNFPHVGEDDDARYFLKLGAILDAYGEVRRNATQLGIAFGGGTKLPLGNHLAIRAEAGGGRRFKNDEFFAAWEINGSVGISFFTR